MASYTLSPIGGAGSQFFDNSGNVLTGGKLYTYAAGTTTPQTTWTTPAGITANSNPIILNSAGRPAQEIWLSWAHSYKFVLKDSNDVLIATYDNIPGLPQPAIANDASSISYEPNVLVTAGSFVIGQTYMIASLGTTDFTAIGAGYNSTGVIFTASGAGTGTGTAYVSTTVEAKLRETVSVKDFGAVGDGITDDTTAIQAAYAFMPTNGSLYFPAGIYKYTSQLTFSGNKHPSFIGDGAFQSVLEYSGSSLTNDCIVIGNGINIEYGWTISGLGFSTSVNTTGGALVRFKYLAQSWLSNINFSNQGASTKPYIAGWFDGLDNVSVSGIQAFGSQECLRVNGSISGPKADLFISNGKIGGGLVGLHIAGGMGGFYCDSCDIIASFTNVLIDKTIINETNREIFFGPGALLDSGVSAPGVWDGINVDIQDTSPFVLFTGVWNASAGTLLRTGASYTGNLQINGGFFFNAFTASGGNGNAIEIGNTSAIIDITGSNFSNIFGTAVLCTAGISSNISLRFPKFNSTVVAQASNINSTTKIAPLTNISVLNGHTPIKTSIDTIPSVSIYSGPNNGGSIGYGYYGDAPASGWFTFAKSRNATFNSHTIVQTNDALGSINFDGSNGTSFIRGAKIGAVVTATPGTTEMPTDLQFFTRNTGDTNFVHRISVFRDGTLAPSTDNTYSCGANGLRWSSVWAANGTIQTSDERTKTDIQPASLGLDFINALKPISYKWIVGANKVIGVKDDGTPLTQEVPGVRTHWGLRAQDVKAAADTVGVDFGGWVLTDKNDPDSQQALRYDQFVAPLIKAVQELSARVAELEEK